MNGISDNIRPQFNAESGKWEIVASVDHDIRREVAELKQILEKGHKLAFEVKQYRKKRSLDANSYCWVLIGKLADALRTDKDALYIEMLKRYGQREPKLLSVISEAVDMVYRATNNHCCVVGTSELNGKEFSHMAILIGSSQYDSKSMAILIDGIVSECKEQSIETLPPREIERMKSEWRK